MTQIIGIDHGNAQIKTVHFSFPSGVVEYEHEPYTNKNVLEYGGKYYVCGTGRQPLTLDKTATESYYLLTLAALAKEIEIRNLPAMCSVTLAVGLPLTTYGRDKKNFRSYLKRDALPVNFRYEGKPYEVTVSDVQVFPQGYSAILSHRDMLIGEPSVILADIGGWTVDIMRLDRGIPNASTCRSLELGMIRCIDEISEQVRRRTGKSLTAAQIETILADPSYRADNKVRDIVETEAERYISRLLSAIAESGFDATAMPVIFMGGGAALMKRSVAPLNALCRAVVIPDVCMNAIGYEALCGQMSRSVGNE